MKKATISPKSVKRLFASSGGVCAFPGCTTNLVDSISGAILGEMCHINAASPSGPRFEPSLSESDRSKEDNLIILCPTHHSLVDQDLSTYTAEKLRLMKRSHEARVIAMLSVASSAVVAEIDTTDLARQVDAESIDFAIVVALPKELDAIRHHFPELKRLQIAERDTRTYYAADIPAGEGIKYRIVVTLLPTMGNLDAAHATADLIARWNPRYILVSGIAGGLNRKSQKFGDIIASESIVYYEHGKVRDDRVESRHRQFLADRTLLDGLHHVTQTGWRNLLPERPDGLEPSIEYPCVHIGPIASGEKVIASVKEAERLLTTHRNLIGVEMESAGVASAAFSALKKVGFITIRSICDFADNQKDDNWQFYAAHVAAAYLRSFIESRPVAPSSGNWPKVAELLPEPEEDPIVKRQRIFRDLCAAMDMEDFKSFCFVLGVDVDELPGDRKSARVRELILLFERRKQIKTLEEAFSDFHQSNGD